MRPDPDDVAAWLRARPTLQGRAPELASSHLPDEPVALFLAWMEHAAAAGVPEPHAATLATVADDGVPDARTLVLKGLDARGWAFAGPRSSRNGVQLARHPAAALAFWWQPLVRAVRVRGPVDEASPEESASDLAARSAAARADISDDDWVLWRLRPTRVEFWQGAEDRRHARVVYENDGGGWRRTVEGGSVIDAGRAPR
ncbi:pyridoxal 5'-phosphate synthase [Microbacterium sp. 179-I 3D4 NHS]|uniref:pyridoxine/pyridoxamine 5'-phosphate oxidase n=1 Tax=Microbacterium sp. 179-I 3D4 NHS TaxID=3142381 RepID=UPI0039A23AA8